MSRTIFNAQSAARAKIAVDMSYEILNRDGPGRTVLLALHTAYAAYLADLAGDSALILIGTHHLSRLLAVGDLDDLLWTDLCALSAAHTEIAVDNSYLIAQLNGMIITFPGTVA